MAVPGDQPGPNPNPEVTQQATPPAQRSAVDATKYVGTPAVGTSKAAASAGLSSSGPSNTDVDRRRREPITGRDSILHPPELHSHAPRRASRRRLLIALPRAIRSAARQTPPGSEPAALLSRLAPKNR